jgi:hypothetical protein
MDFSLSPFRNKNKQQTLVFDFSNVPNHYDNYDDDDESSEVCIGEKKG